MHLANLKVPYRAGFAQSINYLKIIEKVSELPITGGVIYDAIIAEAALKAQVDILLTFNPKHFTRLGEQISSLVQDISASNCGC